MHQNLVNTKQLLTLWKLTGFPKLDGVERLHSTWDGLFAEVNVVFFTEDHFFNGIFLSKIKPCAFPTFGVKFLGLRFFGKGRRWRDGAVFCFLFTLIFVVGWLLLFLVVFVVVKSVFWDMCCFFLRFALRTDTVIYVILWNYISIWRTLRFDSICLVLIF